MMRSFSIINKHKNIYYVKCEYTYESVQEVLYEKAV